MKQPIEPSEEDCCNSGCNPCIFDVYQRQLLVYKKYLEGGPSTNKELGQNIISELEYALFTVLENLIISKDHHLLIFKAASVLINHKVLWNSGQHFLIKYISGDKACTRAYTPLKLKLKTSSEFSVIVKRYEKGVVSNYLCDLKPGQETLWRGPYGSYAITPNEFSRIIMIAQGTGVAPFYSIIENILGNEEDMTKIILFYCCQSIDSILFREELYLWRSYWNFSYGIYLSNSSQNLANMYKEPIFNNKLCPGDLMKLTLDSTRDQILLCGSSQFMEYFSSFLQAENIENVIKF